MKILEQIEKIADLGQTTLDLQREMNVFEAGHLWNLLTSRYDIIEMIQISHNFANDAELKLVLNSILKHIEQQVAQLEKIGDKYGIPLPEKPPAGSKTANNIEVVTDEYIFKRVFAGIQIYMYIYASALVQTTSVKLREKIFSFFLDEINTFDNLLLYGQLKGWVNEPPAYRV